MSSVSPLFSHRFPFKLRGAAKTYFAFRRVDYHFRQDYKSIFLGFNEHVIQSQQGRQPHRHLPITFSAASYVVAVLRGKLVNATVVVRSAVHSRAVEISESIDDHAVVGKSTIWRALERMNDTLSPLSAANRS